MRPDSRQRSYGEDRASEPGAARSSKSLPFDELEVVYLLAPRPEEDLRRGDRGTVVHRVEKAEPAAYLVEFVRDDGTTHAEAFFSAEELSRIPLD